MAAPSHRIPKLTHHKASGRAVVRLNGDDHYLGPHGSPESQERYDRLIQEWLLRGRQPPQPAQAEPLSHGPPDARGSLTVSELILAFWRHAEQHYHDSPAEQERIRLSVRPLRELYGRTPAGQFGPLALRAVRQRLIDQGLARTTINQRVGVLKRLFAWAVECELVPPAVSQGLQTVKGLRQRRSAAKESRVVRPVGDADIEATLPWLSSRQLRAMVRLQRLTGARSGEICIMCWADIDCSGPVWVYRPRRYKGQHREGVPQREIFLGPRCQEVLAEFRGRDPEAYLFSPAEAAEERRQALRRARKSRVPPSQLCRRKADPKRQPGPRYRVRSYRHAVRRACLKAKIRPWHPHQLRHAAATDLRRQYGVELARIILGHSSAVTTEIYAEADRQQAREAMRRMA